MLENCFYYRAHVVSVYDGDTCRVDLDLGFGVWKMNETLRLNRINAPEMRGEEKAAGRLSRDYLRGLILDQDVMIHSIKDSKGKYGRFLAEIWLFDALQNEWHNINDMLVTAGHAEYHDY